MKLFRIQSIKNESLWYTFSGKYKDRLQEITGQSIPMPYEEFRQMDKKVKLLSSVADMKMFPHWFSEEQIDKLFNSGYSLFEYEVNKGVFLPKGEVLFDFNMVIGCKEIQSEIFGVNFNQPEL